MKITIDDREQNFKHVPPSVVKLFDFVSRLPDGKAITQKNLGPAAGVVSVRSYATHPRLAPFRTRILHGGTMMVVWANEKTTKAIREQNKNSND